MDPLPFLKRFLWISGRSSRLEWWLVHIGALMALAINDAMFLDFGRSGPAGTKFFVVPTSWLFITFLLLWVSFTSIARRLHDRGKSAWWALFYLMPFFGWLWFFIECGFLPGRAQPEETSAPLPAGLVQRVQPRPWTPRRIAKVAGNAIGLSLIAWFLYIWFINPAPPPNWGDVRQHFGAPEKPVRDALPE